MTTRRQENQERILQGAHPDQSSARGISLVQGLMNEEKAAATVASASSSSRGSMGDTAREEPGPVKPDCPQNPHGVSSPPTAMASSESSQCHAGSSIHEVEGASASQDSDAPQIRMHAIESDKMHMIVQFLLRKYQKNEQFSREEVVHMIDNSAHDNFPVIFREICQCMHMDFGIVIKEVDSTAHTYELVSALGLTYSGILDDTDQIVCKADLLILILCVIFLKGNRVSEEYLKDMLRHIKVLSESAPIAVEDMWKFIREDLVQVEYLVYQQVPHSDPARYEFLWGPRALAETTKMKVLEHAIMLDEKYHRACAYQYRQPWSKEKDKFRASAGPDE
ncbi:melanoma-associated antigen 8-like [Octodon degus]|uniref:Melanoma-associated antigen 8-like n=1 Tax=Octodon degus TaxID=10160 RepID=A0A6P3VDQ3_OCTDE|nr:melanoma-associated antigen 8-like [Octodon degus]